MASLSSVTASAGPDDRSQEECSPHTVSSTVDAEDNTRSDATPRSSDTENENIPLTLSSSKGNDTKQARPCPKQSCSTNTFSVGQDNQSLTTNSGSDTKQDGPLLVAPSSNYKEQGDSSLLPAQNSCVIAQDSPLLHTPSNENSRLDSSLFFAPSNCDKGQVNEIITTHGNSDTKQDGLLDEAAAATVSVEAEPSQEQIVNPSSLDCRPKVFPGTSKSSLNVSRLESDEKKTTVGSSLSFECDENFECEVQERDEGASNRNWNQCKKNPGHKNFIPVREFSLKHLPKGYRKWEHRKGIKTVAKLTVRLRVKYTSTDRPDTDFFSRIRGTRLPRNGSGFVTWHAFKVWFDSMYVPLFNDHDPVEDKGLLAYLEAKHDPSATKKSSNNGNIAWECFKVTLASAPNVGEEYDLDTYRKWKNLTTIISLRAQQGAKNVVKISDDLLERILRIECVGDDELNGKPIFLKLLKGFVSGGDSMGDIVKSKSFWDLKENLFEDIVKDVYKDDVERAYIACTGLATMLKSIDDTFTMLDNILGNTITSGESPCVAGEYPFVSGQENDNNEHGVCFIDTKAKLDSLYKIIIQSIYYKYDEDTEEKEEEEEVIIEDRDDNYHDDDDDDDHDDNDDKDDDDSFVEEYIEVRRACPCSECVNSDNPKPKGYIVYIMTAHHVVYDKQEAQNTTVDFFCDDETEHGMVQLHVVDSDEYSRVGDLATLACVTHDKRFINKICKLLKDYHNYYELAEKGSDSSLAVICSHPHGNFKHVTVGEWTSRFLHHRFYKSMWTSYFYNAPTCPGSSGAPVLIIGNKDKTLALESHLHTHHGSECQELNKSSRFLGSSAHNEGNRFRPKVQRKIQKERRDVSKKILNDSNKLMEESFIKLSKMKEKVMNMKKMPHCCQEFADRLCFFSETQDNECISRLTCELIQLMYE